MTRYAIIKEPDKYNLFINENTYSNLKDREGEIIDESPIKNDRDVRKEFIVKIDGREYMFFDTEIEIKSGLEKKIEEVLE